MATKRKRTTKKSSSRKRGLGLPAAEHRTEYTAQLDLARTMVHNATTCAQVIGAARVLGRAQAHAESGGGRRQSGGAISRLNERLFKRANEVCGCGRGLRASTRERRKAR